MTNLLLVLILIFLFVVTDGASRPIGSSLSDALSSNLAHNIHENKMLRLRGGSTTEGVNVNSVASSAPYGAAMVIMNAHAMSVEDCLKEFEVNESVGLSTNVANSRIQIYGPNSLASPPVKSIWRLILEQFDDRLVQILLCVASISAALAVFENDIHAFAEPLIIVSILILNSLVGVWQSKSAESSLDALKKLQPDSACVLREGSWQSEFPVSQIVPGDIIYLRVGDKVPVDGRIIALKTTTFGTDESSLTGESVSVSKTTSVVDMDSTVASKTNMVFSGTMVTNGAAFVLVTRTGMRSEIGIINAGVQEAKHGDMKTPLALKLDEFGQQLTYIIGGICVAVWLVSIPKFNSPVFSSQLSGAIYYAKVAVALGVAAIPEGLPAVITLCLSLGTRRMAKRNVIVRKLSSVETLGCTSVICTDKTGTLTTNQMTVKNVVMFSNEDTPFGDIQLIMKERKVSGVSYEPVGEVEGLDDLSMGAAGLQSFAEICSICNEAEIVYKDRQFARVGEPTEAALRVLVEKLGCADLVKSSDPERMARQINEYWERRVTKLAILEFSRDRKSMSVLCRPIYGSGDRGVENGNRLLVKGAAEVLVSRCTTVQLEDGTIVPLDDSFRNKLRLKLDDLARRPLRCLALAFKCGAALGDLNYIGSSQEASSSELLQDTSNFIEIEQDLVLVGICGIKDPARPEAAESILKCRDAGIRVMMITGDSKETAVAIARDVNIFDPNQDTRDSAFTGKEFFSLPEEKQLQLLRTGNKVFCRTEPRDKQKLVVMLEKLGEIPAMTGDGVNDAPALQQAAIGVAMGITGTEVAKNAADMILADDNFATIVSAVEEGRCIYGNMQSFICFLISSNIGEIATIFLSTLIGLPEPLTPLHLLWVNLVTDGPPATALGFNPPDPDAMMKPPRPSREPILSKWLLTRYVITGLYVGFAAISVFVWWYLDKGLTIDQLMHWNSCPEWEGFQLPSLALEQLNLPSDFSPCDIFTKMRARPQTMALSALVTMEMLKALSAISLDTSLLKLPPWRNPWLLLGVLLPSLCHMIVLHTPFLAKLFGLSPLLWDEWMVRLVFAAVIQFPFVNIVVLRHHYHRLCLSLLRRF